MNSAATHERHAAASLPAALPGVLAVVILGATIVPRGTPVWLSLLGLSVLFLPLVGGNGSISRGLSARVRRLFPSGIDRVIVALLAFAGYCALNCLWSLAPLAGLAKVAWLALVIVIAAVAARAWSQLDDDMILMLTRALIVAFALGAVFVMIEVLSGQSISKWVYNTWSTLRPSLRKHLKTEGDVITAIAPYVPNRNIGALNLLLWPVLLAVWSRPAPLRWRLLTAVVLTIVVLIGTMKSEHESSQIAIILSAIVFLLCWLAPRFGKGLVAVGWVMAVAGMVPAVFLAYNVGLSKTGHWLPDSGKARIELWHFTGTEVLKHPIRGIGVNSTHFIDDDVKPTARKADQVYGDRPGQHSHNIYMQTWFELGAIGALLLLTAGLMLWQGIVRLPLVAQPFALAGFTSAMVIAAFTWGLWQEWYLGLFGLSGLTFALAAAMTSRLKPS